MFDDLNINIKIKKKKIFIRMKKKISSVFLYHLIMQVRRLFGKQYHRQAAINLKKCLQLNIRFIAKTICLKCKF